MTWHSSDIVCSVSHLSPSWLSSYPHRYPLALLQASGYILYSSATMMVVSVGSGVHGFTLDTSIGEFVLTHPNMKVPERGQIYSLNDAR